MWSPASRPPAQSSPPAARCPSRPDHPWRAGAPASARHAAWGGNMFQLVLFNVTNGLIIGAFYVLMALGLSLIINLSNVINFAHGNFLALGGYLAFTLSPALGYWGAL